MLPIAVLPVAGLLLRLGQPDLLDLPYVAAAGNAVFENLGLLFAIGVAVGLANGNNGTAGLAAVVAYLVTTEGAKVIIQVPPGVLADAVGNTVALLADDYRSAAIAKLSVPAGLISGILAGNLYNRYAEIRLPDYLAFFAGRRFVPIVSGFAALLVAAMFGFGWPVLEIGMNSLSAIVVGAGEFGLFAYGVLNRVLIITGLHHILNNLAWFLVGDYEGVTGDLRRYFAGDPTAGAFMSGFFPVMMFGLPAACFAMYRSVPAGRRKAVGGLLLSMGLTSFLTGITEPIEFTFMFVAPVLYVIHALLTGLSMAVMDYLGIRLGFGFSAGLFDYILNYNRATHPLWLLPFGALYFAVYYSIFRYYIVRFNVKTPGRDDLVQHEGSIADTDASEAESYLSALGGADNVRGIDACTTRLRLTIASMDKVDRNALKILGAAGFVQPTGDTLQVVVGLRADEIATAMSRIASRPRTAIVASKPASSSDGFGAPPTGMCQESSLLLEALGGVSNVRGVSAIGTRLRVLLQDSTLASEALLLQLGFRGLAMPEDGVVHVLAEHDAEPIAEMLHSAIHPG